MNAPIDNAPLKSTAARTAAKVWLLVAGVLGFVAASLYGLRMGTASRSDGETVVARVERAGDGNCLVGGQREHCYRLQFSVLPKGEPMFSASLDVNVPDRWASRIQPGSFVWVVRNPENRAEVLLALDAFEEPAPTPSDTPR